MRPSAWPNSCKMTRQASASLTPGVSQPKFIVGCPFATFLQVVPITDHDPLYLKLILTMASVPSTQLKFRLASPSIHPTAYFFTNAFCSSVPSRNAMVMVAPGSHLLLLTRAALALPSLGGSAANHAKHHCLF